MTVCVCCVSLAPTGTRLAGPYSPVQFSLRQSPFVVAVCSRPQTRVSEFPCAFARRVHIEERCFVAVRGADFAIPSCVRNVLQVRRIIVCLFLVRLSGDRVEVHRSCIRSQITPKQNQNTTFAHFTSASSQQPAAVRQKVKSVVATSHTPERRRLHDA